MRLSTRLTVAMVALVLLTAIAIGLLTYRNIETAVLPRALDRLDLQVELLATNLENSVVGARADTIGFRSAVGVDGLIAASLGSEPVNGLTFDQWRARIARRFAAELRAKPLYHQFRIIGVADGGREIVRVDRSGDEGAVRIVPAHELQQKGDRGYFQAAIRLAEDEVFVSPIELN